MGFYPFSHTTTPVLSYGPKENLVSLVNLFHHCSALVEDYYVSSQFYWC